MKIVFYLFFPEGGIGQYTHELLQELVKYEDLDIELVCLPEYTWASNPWYKTAPILFSISSRFPLVRRIRFLLGQFINPLRLCRHAKKAGADIVHICHVNYFSYPVWRRAMEHSGALMVVSAHDIRRAKAILHRGYESRKLIQFYRSCVGYFVHSLSQQEDLQTYADVPVSAIKVVPHGPLSFQTASEPVRLGLSASEASRVMLFFGRTRDDKNLDGLLEAMALLEDPPHLLIAGAFSEGSHRNEAFYRAAIKRLQLQDQVSIMNRHIPDDEVDALFKRCDFVVLPYRCSFTSQSAVLNIAVSTHTPVLATPCSTFKQTLESYRIGELSEGEDPASLAKALTAMSVSDLSSFEFDRYLAANSWRQNAELTRDFYRTLVDYRPGGCSTEVPV